MKMMMMMIGAVDQTEKGAEDEKKCAGGQEKKV